MKVNIRTVTNYKDPLQGPDLSRAYNVYPSLVRWARNKRDLVSAVREEEITLVYDALLPFFNYVNFAFKMAERVDVYIEPHGILQYPGSDVTVRFHARIEGRKSSCCE